MAKGDAARAARNAADPPPGLRFTVSGKLFRVKPGLPDPKFAPDLRVAALLNTDGKTYPVLLDDVLHLYSIDGPRKIERMGSYNHRGLEVQCYKLIPISFPDPDDLEFYQLAEIYIRKARKAGVNLN